MSKGGDVLVKESSQLSEGNHKLVKKLSTLLGLPLLLEKTLGIINCCGWLVDVPPFFLSYDVAVEVM